VNPKSLTFKALEFYGTRIRHRGQWRVMGSLRKWLKADVDANLMVIRDGHKWILNPSDYVQSDLFWLGIREPWDVFHAKQFVRPGCVIFDVGANFGHYSITLGGKLLNNGAIHAFEPFPPNVERLKINIALNQLENTVRVHKVALSDGDGSGFMTVRDDNSGSATLAATGKVSGHEVRMTTLDSFCSNFGLERLDLIKIDVEGHEERLLRGGLKTLAHFRPVLLIELDPPKLLRAGTSVERLASLINELGYTLHVASHKFLIPLNTLPKGDNILNAFALPIGTEVSSTTKR
jgi:FkbM family methyltransferase